MAQQLEGTWEEFERWIRDAIGSEFRWCVRPRDTAANRKTMTSLKLNDLERSEGIFPEKNAFIEKT